MQKDIDINIFDVTNVKQWNKIAGVFNERCEKIHLNCNSLTEDMVTVSRIGSESSDAVVYKTVTPNGCEMAAKVLLFRDEKSKLDIANEIKIAEQVSIYTTTSGTHRFPIMFGAYKCHDIKFPDVDISQLTIVDQAKHFQKRNGGLKGYIMFSELLWGDLIQLYEKMRNIKNNKNDIERVFDIIIPEIFLAIQDLHNLGISHDDLHFGNILLRINPNMQFDVVIHDFGKSKFIDSWTQDTILRDFEMIQIQIDSRPRLNETIVGQKMAKMSRIVREFRKNVPTNIYNILYQKWNEKTGAGIYNRRKNQRLTYKSCSKHRKKRHIKRRKSHR